MSKLVSKKGALKVKAEVCGVDEKDIQIAKDFFNQVNNFHNMDFRWECHQIESLLLKQKEWELSTIKKKPTYNKGLVRFNPSGASKCERELFFKAMGEEQESDMYPYHKRWTRNAEAVHEAMQRDLLYMDKYLDKSLFKVLTVNAVLGDGVEKERWVLPAWERNLLTWKEFTHNGQTFLINGMMDGVLEYQPTGKMIGFEFKTKSTTIATVGTYKMKDVQDSHRQQCISYSCLFFGDVYEDRTDTFVVMYESLAKDGWTKGAEAREDFRVFQVEVTKEERMELLDKFARVTKMVKENDLPETEEDKCFFCPFKHICKGEE